MLNNRMKKLIVALLLLAGGIVFIVWGSITLKQTTKFPKTTAVVTHVQREFTPDGEGGETEEIHIFVTYTAEGKTYNEELQNTKTSLREGDVTDVVYNPDKPAEVYGASKTGGVLQLVFGGVLALAGLGSAAAVLLKGH
jgi:hypothetical protein